jgi:hypothetical protein
VKLDIDYRSPPSGLGTIADEDNDKVILIQHRDSNPDIKPGIYDEIIYIDIDLQRLEDVNTLSDKLSELGVTKVFDTELAYEFDMDDDQSFSVETWIDNYRKAF